MSRLEFRSSVRRALERRLEELRNSPAYRNYLAVREQVIELKDRAQETSGVDAPSAYWREELQNLDYLIDASPLVIGKLRHHCFYLTGIRPYDYRPNTRVERERFFKHKLDLLIELGGSELLVPESPALGGFGYELDGALYNIDTIKFYEVMVGLERGGVLRGIRSSSAPVVCEIGSGWGGFAYQMKTLFPKTRMILVDFPELFLFSATYLTTVFPGARVTFGAESTMEALRARLQPDFAFVPHNELEALALEQIDLVVNMVSFQEMTSEQVRAYVRWAAEGVHAPYLYSLNRDRSPYNTELTNVREIMREAYELRELEILPYSYGKIVDPDKSTTRPPKRPKTGRVPDAGTAAKQAPAPAADHLDYRHVLGVRGS